MAQDRFGLPVTTDSQLALQAYSAGVDRILSANAGAEALLGRALALDPCFALAHIALVIASCRDAAPTHSPVLPRPPAACRHRRRASRDA